MKAVIEHKLSKIEDLCKVHHVKKLYLFGSVLRNDFTDNSDLDFLVTFNDQLQQPLERVKNEDSLIESVERIFHKEVDLVQYRFLRNKYLRHFINQEKNCCMPKRELILRKKISDFSEQATLT